MDEYYKAYTLNNGLIETDSYNYVKTFILHREDGPAYIEYESGLIVNEIYLIYNKRHRLDGPAYIEYDNYGNIIVAEYYVNGILHRLDGPAILEYDHVGITIRESYYINGYHYTKENYYKELLKLKVQSL